MAGSEGFQSLEAYYTALASTTPSAGEDLAERDWSLRYFAVDRSIENGDVPEDPSVRIRTWISNVRLLEHEIAHRGSMPPLNQQDAGGEMADEVRRVIWWKADQLRPATRRHHCSYQTRRLEGLTGFSWSPLDDRWDAQLELYKVFAKARHAPKYRAGGADRHSARWAQRQRDLYRRHALDLTRISRLEATGLWTW